MRKDSQRILYLDARSEGRLMKINICLLTILAAAVLGETLIVLAVSGCLRNWSTTVSGIVAFILAGSIRYAWLIMNWEIEDELTPEMLACDAITRRFLDTRSWVI